MSSKDSFVFLLPQTFHLVRHSARKFGREKLPREILVSPSLGNGRLNNDSRADSKTVDPRRSRETALPIVRDNYRINKFTSRWNAYNISTSAKWCRDTLVYHAASYRLLPVTHCPACVVSSDAFGSRPPCVYGARIVFSNRSPKTAVHHESEIKFRTNECGNVRAYVCTHVLHLFSNTHSTDVTRYSSVRRYIHPTRVRKVKVYVRGKEREREGVDCSFSGAIHLTGQASR